MCRAQAEGGQRCVRSARLEKLTSAELAPPSGGGAPDVDWAGEDLAGVWTDNDRPVACAAIGAVEIASAKDARTFADMETAADAAGASLYGAAFRVKSPVSLARKITVKQMKG